MITVINYKIENKINLYQDLNLHACISNSTLENSIQIMLNFKGNIHCKTKNGGKKGQSLKYFTAFSSRVPKFK